MTARHPFRRLALACVAGFGLAIWAFPVLWGLMTSFKTERDVLAYPPVVFFQPTLANYREVIFGAFVHPAQPVVQPRRHHLGYAADHADCDPRCVRAGPAPLSGKRTSGFYVLATQMLPPVGLIIPYYLALQKIGGLDTYSGLTVIYLTFFAAVRDLADGHLLRGRAARDGGSSLAGTVPDASARSGT